MKKVSAIGEFGLISRIQKKVRIGKNVILGIGDDAAVLKIGQHEQLLSTDLLVENVDFTFRSAKPEEVGRKALAVNLSDIAAMGGRPEAVVIGLAIPKSASLSQVDRFHRGFIKLANQFKVSVVGGDLSRGPCWMIAVTILGTLPSGKPVLRKGIRPGDLICVTGNLGGSIIKKHLLFNPRVLEGEFLGRFDVHAMIDVSDGLVQDLKHMLCASNVAARIWLDQIPISKDAIRLSRNQHSKALVCALTDGEDFELLFSVSKNQWNRLKTKWQKHFRVPIHAIGMAVSGKSEVSFWRNGSQIKFQLPRKGYEHFA